MRILYITRDLDGPARKPDIGSWHVLKGLFKALEKNGDEVIYFNCKEERMKTRTRLDRRQRGEDIRRPAGISRKIATVRKAWTTFLFSFAPGAVLFWQDLMHVRRQLEVMGRTRPDVIVARKGAAFSCVLARMKGIPSVVHRDGLYEAEAQYGYKSKTQIRLSVKLLRKILKASAGHFAVVTEVVQETLVRKGFRPKDFTVLHNGVDIEAFHPDVPRHPIAETLGGKIVVGFVGSFSPWHKIDDFIAVIPSIIRRDPSIVFLFIGKGRGWEQADSLSKRLDISSNIKMMGSVPHEEVPSLVACFDVGVIPFTTYSCSPLKIYEYMAMGKPAIAPKWKSIEAIIDHGIDGYLFTPDDLSELQAAILHLAQDSDLRERMGRAAREKMVSRFTWSHCASRFQSACQAAIESSR